MDQKSGFVVENCFTHIQVYSHMGTYTHKHWHIYSVHLGTKFHWIKYFFSKFVAHFSDDSSEIDFQGWWFSFFWWLAFTFWSRWLYFYLLKRSAVFTACWTPSGRLLRTPTQVRPHARSTRTAHNQETYGESFHLAAASSAAAGCCAAFLRLSSALIWRTEDGEWNEKREELNPR